MTASSGDSKEKKAGNDKDFCELIQNYFSGKFWQNHSVKKKKKKIGITGNIIIIVSELCN